MAPDISELDVFGLVFRVPNLSGAVIVTLGIMLWGMLLARAWSGYLNLWRFVPCLFFVTLVWAILIPVRLAARESPHGGDVLDWGLYLLGAALTIYLVTRALHRNEAGRFARKRQDLRCSVSGLRLLDGWTGRMPLSGVWSPLHDRGTHLGAGRSIVERHPAAAVGVPGPSRHNASHAS